MVASVGVPLLAVGGLIVALAWAFDTVFRREPVDPIYRTTHSFARYDERGGEPLPDPLPPVGRGWELVAVSTTQVFGEMVTVTATESIGLRVLVVWTWKKEF